MSDATRPLLPEDCFWITEGEHLRIARKVGVRDKMWLLDIFRNPDEAHDDRAMARAVALEVS